MYGPSIKSAKAMAYFELDTHVAVLLAEIVSAGAVQYLYVLAVHPAQDQPATLYVTAEMNMMDALLGEAGGASAFLCTFEGGTHNNYGSSKEWTDLRKFAARALRLAAEHLNCPVERIRRVESKTSAVPGTLDS
jgi:hypothetical protein